MSNKVPALIQWWVSPKLPQEHIFILQDKRPKKLSELTALYFRKWLAHPIKRRVAKYWLLLLQKFRRLKVIGITGSAGKTTTKNMIEAILMQKGKTVATIKNIDPIYNIPTTILKCTLKTKYLILEMGVEYPGEMDFYLWLARPSIGVITNIYPTHTQFLQSVEGVAKEKIKLIQTLPQDGYAVLNSENPFVKKYSKETKAKIIWYGEHNDIRAENQVITPKLNTKYQLNIGQSKIDVQLPLLGHQFVSNSLAAASVAHICGATLDEIKYGLENFFSEEHRMKVFHHQTNAIILDDSYNNNPEAAKEALLTLKSISSGKKTIVVFGDMLELGKLEEAFHRKIGQFIASLKIDYLIGVGVASRWTVNEASKIMPRNHLIWVNNTTEAYFHLTPILKQNCVILIKGSRSIGLDKLVHQLSQESS